MCCHLLCGVSTKYLWGNRKIILETRSGSNLCLIRKYDRETNLITIPSRFVGDGENHKICQEFLQVCEIKEGLHESYILCQISTF